MKILHLSPRVPFPPSDGGSIGIYNIVTGMEKAGNEVHLLCANTPKHYIEGQVLEGIKQFNVPVNTNITVKNAFLNLFKDLPYIVERFISKQYNDKLIELLRTNNYDAVQVEGTFVSWYIDTIKKYFSGPVIIRAHNVEGTIWERLALNEKNFLKKLYYQKLARRLKKFEAKIYQKFDGVAAITKEDEERFRKLGVTKPIRIIPAGVPMEQFQPIAEIKPKPYTVLFIGALDWIPNQEGVKWFLEEVWPSVIRKLPQLDLHIAGKGTPESFMQMQLPKVHFHGFVDSAQKFMHEYDLMVVPLLSGGGMRIKIIEGMALKKTMVTSAIGAEGIEYTDRKNIIISNTPEEWINSIVEYFNHPGSFEKVGDEARKLIEDRYSNESVIRMYMDFHKGLKKQ